MYILKYKTVILLIAVTYHVLHITVMMLKYSYHHIVEVANELKQANKKIEKPPSWNWLLLLSIISLKRDEGREGERDESTVIVWKGIQFRHPGC